VKITQLDHLVLTVQDINQTINFYTKILLMTEITFGNNRKALQFGKQKINLHQQDQEILPNAKHAMSGSADLCFLTETPLTDVIKHLQNHQITIIAGIVERTGALGKIHSIYIRDPDGNLIEISRYVD
jgi:virulence protein STM3117